MAQNKRVALTLKPQTYAILNSMSKATNSPMTAIITELVEASLPIMEQVVKSINQAKKGQNKVAIETMANYLQEASTVLNQAHIDFGSIKAKNDEQ